MLTIQVTLEEGFDESTQEFVAVKEFTLDLEHSLVSLSKWESKFEKPFLSTANKTPEETLWYIKAMILTPDVPDDVVMRLSKENFTAIQEYITSKQTATWFAPSKSNPSRETITAELVYYWMVAHNIPFECQYWHFNRLITLVQVCNVKNEPPKKMTAQERAEQQWRLNKERQERYNTTG